MLLWVAGWFPNSENPYNGIFIHRHAVAVSYQIKNLTVLTFVTYFIGENRPGRFDRSAEYQSIIVPVPQFKGRVFKLLNFFIYYFVALGKMLQLILELQPDHVHVHAADKIGVVAAFWKSFFNYKLWLTEHWAIFNDWVSDRFEKRNVWFRMSYKFLWKKTDVCASINVNLHESMEKTFNQKKKVILFSNVLDSAFENAEVKRNLPQSHCFLHVSNFEPRKNVDLIIAAFRELKKEIPSSQLILVGAPLSRKEKWIQNRSDICDDIQVFRAVSAPELSVFYQKASALILASDSENAPCVISEALAFGVPVIASNVGGISEMIDLHNGVLIQDWNPQENNSAKTLKIATAMLDFCKKCENFDRLLIQQNAMLNYSSESVAKQLINHYTCAE